LSIFALAAAAHAAPAYIRTPDLHGDQIVFAAVGDLWVVPASGGTPRHLTSSPGIESQPTFSPDGKWIAFTGQYDGNSDVYVIPSGGGEPVRLTWSPGADQAVAWTEQGEVVFRTGAFHPHGSYELFTIGVSGGADPVRLPLGWAARAAIDPKSGTWALDRIGYEGRTWKRYRGGMAGDLWVGTPEGGFTQLTKSAHSESFPMWSGGRLYFLSDRGGTADLWSVAADGTDEERHTVGSLDQTGDVEGGWDARTPAVGDDGRIVLSRAGDLKLFDPATGEERLVPVDLEAERTLARRRYPDAKRSPTWYTLTPDGDRLAFVTRGEVFSVPVEEGPVLPITATSGARESWASFSPDGKRVVYVTDADGEEAIVTADAWGRGEVKVVVPAGEGPTGSGWHFWPTWSPDGKRIAWSDNQQRLWVASADGTGAPKQVDHNPQAEIRDYTWSPDGRYLAYTKHDALYYGSIFVWASATGEVHQVSPDTTDDNSPAWDPEGRYLYYASERGTNPVLGQRDFQVIEARTSRLVMALLRDDVEDPFADDAGMPGADPPVVEEKKRRKKKRLKEEEAAKAAKQLSIDFDGIVERQIVLPVERGNYGGLSATEGALFFVEWATVGMVEQGGEAALKAFDLEEEEVVTVLDKIDGYEIAANRDKMVLSKDKSLYVVDAKPGPADLSDGSVDLSGVVVELDPREEWRQIFFEAWRHERDFYWDASMSGVDWAAVRDQYAALLPRISTRDELKDLLGEVIGELATSHTYVWGGEEPNRIDWVGNGLLGADLRREGDAYQVVRIYRGDPADEVVNPLQAPGQRVEEGEYILAVNHRPVREGRPLLAELEGKAGVPVVLTVSKTPSRKGSRTVVVVPVASEGRLRYVDWVRQNREYVEEKSGGKYGYVHVPDMGTQGLVAFETWFYPQLDKQGMVVDVRWNGGGFVSQLLVERLRRQLTAFDRSRGGAVYTYPARVLNGPFVVLLNEFAGSDGDIFPKAIQDEALAPVIGMRSWGGIVGIRADKALVDGGILTQPEFAGWYPDGGWVVENHGVDPDIEVQNFPQELAKGIDSQLDRGLAELERLREERPPIVPDFGPAPDKSRSAYSQELDGSGGSGTGSGKGAQP
jgi:tricorn protease